MKKIFIICIFFPMIQIFGQATPNKNILQESDFNDLIFNVELNKANIYDKAILWFAENFKSSKAVIEIQDKQAGKIIGNGSFTIPWVFFEATTTFTISIDIKDGKYKVKYSNLILDYGQAKVSVIEEKFNITEDIRQNIFKKFNAINLSLKNYIESKEKDW